METLTQKLARLRQELEDVRIAKRRILRVGQSSSLGGTSYTQAQADYLDNREYTLQDEVDRIENIKAGQGNITPGIAQFRPRSDTRT